MKSFLLPFYSYLLFPPPYPNLSINECFFLFCLTINTTSSFLFSLFCFYLLPQAIRTQLDKKYENMGLRCSCLEILVINGSTQSAAILIPSLPIFKPTSLSKCLLFFHFSKELVALFLSFSFLYIFCLFYFSILIYLLFPPFHHNSMPSFFFS